MLKVWKNSSWVELLAADELHIVDQQHVGRTELFLEIDGVLLAKRPDEPIHELLGGQIDDGAAGLAFPDVPGDGVHEVGLAEADAAIQEQRIERHVLGLRHSAGGGVGELVRLAHDELIEGEPGIEGSADFVDVEPAGPLGIPETAIRRVVRRARFAE